MLIKSKKLNLKKLLFRTAVAVSLTTFLYGGFSAAYMLNPTFKNGINSVLATFNSAKAGTTNTVAEQALPSNGDVFRVVPGSKQKIAFEAIVKSDSGKQVFANVIYQRVGESQWTSFGTAPTTDMYGKQTKPNNRTTRYININGWNCQMSFSGTTTPPDCTTKITKNGITGLPSLPGEKIYFPAIDFGPGTYRWAVKGKTSDNSYVSWSIQKWFTVRNLNKVYNSVRTDKKMVAITFDDGPYDTTGYCKILNAYGAKASFFFVGERLDAAPKEAKIAQTCGEVANHTENHIWFNSKTTFAQAYPQFANDETSITAAGGVRTNWARPRGGIVNTSIVDAAIKTNEVIVNWSIKAYDYGPDNPTRQQIVNRIVYSPDLKPGAIILLHQRYGHTKEALPTILSLLRDKGYKVTTVSELINNSY